MTTNEKIDFTISNVLLQIGVPSNIVGYKFLFRAVQIAVQNPWAVLSVTKAIYKQIAKEFQTTLFNVERSIRYAIDKTKNKLSRLNQIFQLNLYSDKEKPSNGELISVLADRIPYICYNV